MVGSTSESLPAPSPISSSDHTTVHVLPVFTCKVRIWKSQPRKSQPRKKKLKANLSKDNTDILKDSLDTTDWNVFRESSNNIDQLNEVVSCYGERRVCSKKGNPGKRIPADAYIKRLENKSDMQ